MKSLYSFAFYGTYALEFCSNNDVSKGVCVYIMMMVVVCLLVKVYNRVACRKMSRKSGR